MTNRQLFLKLTDLLLFSLLVKSQAGLDELEDKENIFITSPREYFWIFILNQKLGKNLNNRRQNSLVRTIFWVWQAVFQLKRYYKEKNNRRKNLSYREIIFHKIRWFRSILEQGDSEGFKTMNLSHFYKQFGKEIENR